MAKRINRVLLGFEDEAITDKYKSQVDFTCNKIGGKPDWPNGENRQNPTCCLCSLSLPLILQIYAPIENSFHRTLYIFACINPNCWNQNGSWVCLRSHVPCGTGGGGRGGGGGVEVAVNMSTDWCEGADNWEDEQNGNTIELLSNQVSSDDDHDKSTIELLSNQVSSDEDHDITAGLAELNVNQRNTNANRRGGGMSGAGGGAMGRLLSPTASAEIEGGDESEVVTIDTPPTAQVNVISLFEQAAPVPQVPSSSLYFSPYFISVGEEERCTSNSPTNAEHVRELMHGSSHAVDGGSGNGGGGNGGSGEVSGEKYERSLPAHGDKMFHTFLCRIQSNPGQLLRYCRDGGSPLFLYPPHDLPSRCRYCHGELAFELQLLPTIISRLRLVTSSTGAVDPAEHLEFGSVFLFACRRSCWTLGDSFREEQLYVQVEKI